MEKGCDNIKFKMSMFTFLSLIVLVFVLIGSVSATDTDNDTVISASDDNEIVNSENDLNVLSNDIDERLSASDEVDEVSADDTEEILSDDAGTWSELREEIGVGGDITLSKKSYKYDSGDTITISTAGVIDGNGTVIDMSGSSIQAFYETVSGVTFKNLTIKNVKCTQNGGAIRGFGTVINCNFINNHAEDGGALYGSGTIENCSFVNNTGSTSHGYSCSGGAIYATGGTVSNCIFTGNTISDYGGAIYGTLNVKNCNFTSNTASEEGGAIYITSGTVTDCNFISNHADKWCGAISGGTASNCNFTNNTAGYLGGAIGGVTAKNCNFITNSATWGGAISGGTATNCNLTSNTASENGGAAYNTYTMTNCNFRDNKASTDTGGAIYCYYSGNVTNCNFTSNTASTNGGAIYFDEYSGTVTNCIFTGNKAEYGGAIYCSYYGTVTNCIFTGNTASENGGAINGSCTVENCNFSNNKASYNAGAINGHGAVINCIFTNNVASMLISAIGFDSGTVTNCTFTGHEKCTLYFHGNGTVENCNFTGNSGDWGGALFFDGNGTVENCNFISNTASRGGGAINFQSSGNVLNCNFISNTAAEGGGAIRFIGVGTVIKCNFTGNKASSGIGGAVEFRKLGTVKNSNFNNNTASTNGGAIYFYDSCDVRNSIFNGNNANSGSAIYFNSSSSSKRITNGAFLNNRANVDDNDPLNVTINENNIKIIFTGKDNLINAIYSAGDVDFTSVTYWGANGITNTEDSYPTRSTNEAGQNITVGVVVNGTLVLNEVKVTDGNGAIVLDVSVGDNYYICVRHDGDSYYKKAEKTLVKNMEYYVNVTSQATNNKTVNITAKSNIYGDFMPGQLQFSVVWDKINANCTADGIWWAVYAFDDYFDYEVSASYSGLDNVNITGATINITKADSVINLDDFNLDYGTSNITITAEGTLGITAKINNNDVFINTYTILLSDLDAGEYTLTVTSIPDEDHNSVNKTVKMTVNKVDSTLTVNNITLDYGSSTNIKVTTEGVTGIIADIDGKNATVNNNTIVIPLLGAGTHTLTVTAIGDANHNNVTKNATITVNKLKTALTASAVTATYNVNKYLVITLKDANGNPLSGVKVTVNLNGAKTYTTGKDGKIKVATKALAAKAYTAKITFAGNTNYYGSAKNVKVTVKKATPKMTAKKKTFKAKTKIKKYTIVLKDNTKKAMKKVKVTLKVKCKTYKAKTNKKGKATFKIKNLKKRGKYTAVIKYGGNTNYNKVTKKVRLSVLDKVRS